MGVRHRRDSEIPAHNGFGMTRTGFWTRKFLDSTSSHVLDCAGREEYVCATKVAPTIDFTETMATLKRPKPDDSHWSHDAI